MSRAKNRRCGRILRYGELGSSPSMKAPRSITVPSTELRTSKVPEAGISPLLERQRHTRKRLRCFRWQNDLATTTSLSGTSRSRALGHEYRHTRMGGPTNDNDRRSLERQSAPTHLLIEGCCIARHLSGWSRTTVPLYAAALRGRLGREDSSLRLQHSVAYTNDVGKAAVVILSAVARAGPCDS